MWREGWRRLSALLAAIANWRFFKPAVFVSCAIPLVLLGYRFGQLLIWNQADALGIDPIKTLEHNTGEDALGVLLATLSVTPVRRIFKINRVQIVRRMLGVWAFAYALVHVTVYAVFDRNCYSLAACQYGEVWTDVLKRKFIFAGLTSFTIMLALAVTSTSGWVRRLKKKWATLHRLVYVAAIAGVVHFIWIQKSDISEPLNWAFWLSVLLGIRVYLSWQKRHAAARPRAA
jgi:sulfoxide reductase heme-binding subunit YedZ